MRMRILYLKIAAADLFKLSPCRSYSDPDYPTDAELQQTKRDRNFRGDRALHYILFIILYFSTQLSSFQAIQFRPSTS